METLILEFNFDLPLKSGLENFFNYVINISLIPIMPRGKLNQKKKKLLRNCSAIKARNYGVFANDDFGIFIDRKYYKGLIVFVLIKIIYLNLRIESE